MDSDRFQEHVSALLSSLDSAVLLSERLEAVAVEAVHLASTLHLAVRRASDAAHLRLPSNGEEAR
jgi:hypothetical protein